MSARDIAKHAPWARGYWHSLLTEHNRHEKLRAQAMQRIGGIQ
jgi:hypothetical protein